MLISFDTFGEDSLSKPIEKAYDEAYEQLLSTKRPPNDIPYLPSEPLRSWSSFGTFQECQEKHRLKYVAEANDVRQDYFEIGNCVHYFIEFRFGALLYQDGRSPLVLKQALLDAGASKKVVEEAWRLFSGYVDHYGSYYKGTEDFPIDDYLWPIASEKQLYDPELHYGYRLDLLAKVTKENVDGIGEGTYLVDFKTKGRFDSSATSWRHYGEILGGLMIWRRNKQLQEMYPDCKGAIVDVIGKQKDQKFVRVYVPFDAAVLDDFEKNLHFMTAQRRMNVATGYWPRNNSACFNQYGQCGFYEVCWGE